MVLDITYNWNLVTDELHERISNLCFSLLLVRAIMYQIRPISNLSYIMEVVPPPTHNPTKPLRRQDRSLIQPSHLSRLPLQASWLIGSLTDNYQPCASLSNIIQNYKIEKPSRNQTKDGTLKKRKENHLVHPKFPRKPIKTIKNKDKI